MRQRVLTVRPALLLICFAATACSEHVVVPDVEAPPVVGNAVNNFGFSVVAQAFDFDETYALDFTGESVSIGVTVVMYAGGRARLALVRADGTELYSRDLSRNIAEGSENIVGRPERAVLHFEGFNGVVSLGVAAPR